MEIRVKNMTKIFSFLGRVVGDVVKKQANEKQEDNCPYCGGTLVFKDFSTKGINTIKMYECMACGAEVPKREE